jgi:hypothetical protein
MDHPNAVYFFVAFNVVMLTTGLLLLAGLMDKGPMKSVLFLPKWGVAVLATLGVAGSLYNLVQRFGSTFGA